MRRGWLFVAMLCVGSTGTDTLRAQEGNTQPGVSSSPSTASPATSPSGSGQTTSYQLGTSGDQTTPTTPRMVPLSGAETLTPGLGGILYSYILPTFEWTGYGDTNPTGFSQHPGLNTQSTYTGSLTLQNVWKHSQLNLSYAGGAFFYSQGLPAATLPGIRPFNSFHSLGLFEQVSTRHWKWLVGDQGMYLPESPIGFFGFGGLTSFGGGLGGAALANAPALSSSFSPDQSISTGLSRRMSDSALSQIEYDPSGRSALTATGSFGTLQFLDPGFIDSRYWVFTAGYSHNLSRHDQVALSYLDYYYRFNGPNRAILNRGFSILYGHQINGKFSLEISVAPLVNQIALPLGGASTKAFLSTFDSLQFRSRNWSGSLSFARMMPGGSGVLPGAETDSEQASIGRQLSRRVHGSLQVSHNYSQSLAQESTVASRSKYEFWEAGISLSREFGRHISMYLNYYAQRQLSNTPVCVGTGCTTALLRQVGGVGINWHALPIKIR